MILIQPLILKFHSFIKYNRALCVLALGLGVIATWKWGGRVVSWLKENFHTTFRTNEVVQARLPQQGNLVIDVYALRDRIARLPIDQINDQNLVYRTIEEIVSIGGILLTANHNDLDGDDFVGIAVLQDDEGEKWLHLCPGGGNRSFDRDLVDRYMAEAIPNLVARNIGITKIAGIIGRHPAETIENFKLWQIDQLAAVQ